MKRYRIWRVKLAEKDKVLQEIFARKCDATDYASYAEKKFPQCEIFIERLEPYMKDYQKMVVKDRILVYQPPF